MPSVSHRTRQHPPVETYFLDDTATQWVQGSSLTGCELDQCPQCGEIQVSDLRRDVKQIGLGPVFILKSRVTDFNRLDIGYKIILVCFTNDVLKRLFGIWLDFMGVPTGSSTNMVHPWWLPDDKFSCRRPSLMTRPELLRLGLHLIKYLGRTIYFDFDRVWSLQSKTSEIGVKEQMSARAHQHRRWMRSNLRQLYRSILAERRFADGHTDGTEPVVFALPRIPDDTSYVEYLQIPTVLLDQPNQESLYLGGVEVPIPPHAFPLQMKDLCLLHEQKLEFVINECLRRDPFSAFADEDCLQIEEEAESEEAGATSQERRSSNTSSLVSDTNSSASFAMVVSPPLSAPVVSQNFLAPTVPGLHNTAIPVPNFVHFSLPRAEGNNIYNPNQATMPYGSSVNAVNLVSHNIPRLNSVDGSFLSVNTLESQAANVLLFEANQSPTRDAVNSQEPVANIPDLQSISPQSFGSDSSPSLESVSAVTPETGHALNFSSGVLASFPGIHASNLMNVPIPSSTGFSSLDVGTLGFDVDVPPVNTIGMPPNVMKVSSSGPQTPKASNSIGQLSPHIESQAWSQLTDSGLVSPIQSVYANEQASPFVTGHLTPVDNLSPTQVDPSPTFFASQTAMYNNDQSLSYIQNNQLQTTALNHTSAFPFITPHLQSPIRATAAPPAFFRVDDCFQHVPDYSQVHQKGRKQGSSVSFAQYPGVTKHGKGLPKKAKASTRNFELITSGAF